jgi:hypothetical protein
MSNLDKFEVEQEEAENEVINSVLQEEEEEKPKPKKKRGNYKMTPERKAQLLENLKKGRERSKETRAKKKLARQIKEAEKLEEIDNTIQLKIDTTNKNKKLEEKILELQKELEKQKVKELKEEEPEEEEPEIVEEIIVKKKKPKKKVIKKIIYESEDEWDKEEEIKEKTKEPKKEKKVEEKKKDIEPADNKVKPLNLRKIAMW